MGGTTEAVPVTSTPGFEEFVAARSSRLLRMAFLLTHDSQLAEDLLQTALARSWSSWRRIEGDPVPYVRRVMVNAFVNERRRRWSGEVPTEHLPERAAAAEDRDAHNDLVAALERLPRGQRAVVVLRYFEDLTEQQTAAVLGIGVGTVKSQCSRALTALRSSPHLHREESSDD